MSKAGARTPKVSGAEALERGRLCFRRQAWEEAFEALSQADQVTPLGAEDLERLIWSATLTGRDEELLRAQERLYHLQVEAGQPLAAARVAFWLGFRLFARGEAGRGGGWIGRAERLVAQQGRDCAEQGFLLLAAGQRHLAAGQVVEAQAAAATAARIGERFKESDLVALARTLEGRARIAQGDPERGLPLMDEAMLAVTAGELSPLVTGLIYCAAIAACHRVYALHRAREWTAALTGWCDAQPQLVMFTGNCLVHRSEILQIGGSWPEAIEEARRAGERLEKGAFDAAAVGRAWYQQAEIHRLRGEFAAAEEAYRNASHAGVEPQPGLALLRLAQDDHGAAASAIRRVLAATPERWQRTRFLPASVEILVAAGALDEAEAAARELEETAAGSKTEVLSAIAEHARAAVHLARGNAREALDPARRAFEVWQQLGAPYLAARLRVLLARACLALDDAEGARLELEGARRVFEQLGAAPDLARLATLASRVTGSGQKVRTHGLTQRELQVLRLVASGKTNKAIARELSLSEKTVDRHVSNIFTKVDVSSRAAATAFAYQNQLL